MKLTYSLVGYDRTSEFAVAEYDIPADKVGAVREIAGMSARDVADFPVDAGQARVIGQIIGQKLDLDHLDFVVEPSRAAVHA
jgi:hypothetical protein